MVSMGLGEEAGCLPEQLSSAFSHCLSELAPGTEKTQRPLGSGPTPLSSCHSDHRFLSLGGVFLLSVRPIHHVQTFTECATWVRLWAGPW